MAARKKSEQDLGRMIRAVGGDWKKFEDRRYCPHCRTLIYRNDNKPFDGIGVIHGHAFPIEVKSAQLNFPFADIKDHQREGLESWMVRHINPGWLALQMGTAKAGSASQNNPRRMWLVSWKAWRAFEVLLHDWGGIVSLPYDSNAPRVRTKVREHQLGAVQLLEKWELTWENGGFLPPDGHLFSLMYDIQPIKNTRQGLNPDGSKKT